LTCARLGAKALRQLADAATMMAAAMAVVAAVAFDLM
jgi:hypothetical protein